MLRVILALIFLSLGGAAMVYAINHAEIEEEEEANRPVRLFNVFVNQCSMNGTLTIERRQNPAISGAEIEDTITKTNVRWLQSNSSQRLFYQVGLNPNDWKFTIYVFQDQAYIYNKTSCTYTTDMNYTVFLNGLGLNKMKQKREESLKLDDGSYQPVIVYSGDPSDNITYQGEEPTVMFAYEDPKTGLNLGWEAYFPSKAKQERIEYWFADMVRREPEPEIFAIPMECNGRIRNRS